MECLEGMEMGSSARTLGAVVLENVVLKRILIPFIVTLGFSHIVGRAQGALRPSAGFDVDLVKTLLFLRNR